MYDFAESRETTAKPAAVWAVYTEVTAWSRWHIALSVVTMAGPFESGSAGVATFDNFGLSQDIKFHLENVEAGKHFDVVWTVGPLLHTRMTHTLEPTASGGTKITHAYHTGGIMAPFNFLQAEEAKGRVHVALQKISELAEARA